MAAGSSSVSPSTNGDINALLSGSAWSTGNLTFSFPSSASFYNYSNTTTNEPSHGFQAITEESPPNMPDAVRVALDRYSAVANVTFTLTTETSSTHADIRFAMSNFDAGGRGYFPGDPPAQSGDVWFSTQSAWSEVLDIGPDDGTSAFLDVMHEIGHALGLSHVGPSMDPAHVGWDYTIMSYQSFPNAPSLLSGEPAQTPMLADVAAVQYMYGANFSTNSGNTIYRWSPTSGQMFINDVPQIAAFANTIYMTLWDGGGIDTYDFSNYTTNVIVDLRPGEWSRPSADQRAVLSNPGDPVVLARGSIANAYLYGGDARSLIENANGGTGDDVLIGNDADNVLTGNDGDDTLRYTGGHDTLLGGRSRVAGDTADFSLSPVGVTISPTATFVTTHLLNGQVVQIPIFEGSSSADDSAHAYSASTFTEVGPIPLADLRGIENLTGSPFADTITGNIADNTIHAGRGDDTVFYTGGFDSLDGGPGNNTVNFSSFSSAVDMTLRSLGSFPEAFTSDGSTIAPNSTLRPIANLLNFSNAVGTPFGDHLQGNSGNNTLDGGGGDDVLFYNGGIDVLNGNTGNDTADFSLFDSAVSVDLTSTGFDAQSNGTTSVLTGNLSGIASLQSIENVNGTNFNDVLHGDGNANVINAEAGIDTVDGGFGNDTLIGGGDVNDTISYQSHDGQALLGQQATISLGLNGADGSYTRSGFTKAGPITFESDVLRGFQNVIGSTQSEIINGNEQDNRFVGRGGNDTINGGAGNDTYDLTGPAAASVGSNTFFDQSGTDNVRINFFSNVTSASRVGNDLVVGLTNGSFRVVNHFAGNPIENLTTFDGQSITLSINNIGGNGSGLIAGGNGGETLDGRGGDDFLFGGNGPDRIIGGDGNDHLTGGNGPDTFVFGSGFGHDVVTDFTAADHLEFDNGLFGSFQAVESATHQVGTDTVITLDPNNSITLQNFDVSGLHASHFTFN